MIIKSDQTPSFNFAVVVDDFLMKVSHIIRGEDHISNTARQIQVYQALKADLPKFAHLPMILGPDKAKLSKRHGATSVIEYKNQGYLAEALLNYLSLLGWSSPNEKEILSKEELIQLFTLERVNKSNAIFDIAKLNWLNGQYIRKFSLPDLFARIKEFINEDYLNQIPEEKLSKMVYSIRDNLDFLTDVNKYLGVYLLDFDDYKNKVASLSFSNEDIEVIRLFKENLEKNDQISTAEDYYDLIKIIQSSTGFKNAQIYRPIRLSCTALEKGPHILEFCSILGREFLLLRLNWLLKSLNA